MDFNTKKKTCPVVITKDLDEGGFVAICDERHAVSKEDTFGEIVENVKKAMDLAAEEEGRHVTNFNMLIIEQQLENFHGYLEIKWQDV